MVKKGFIFFSVLLTLPLVFAQLDIEKRAIQGDIIRELDEPAFVEVSLTNLGDNDTFEIYTLVGGIDILPRFNFPILTSETEKLRVEIRLDESVRKNYGDFEFLYNIKGQKLGITKDRLKIKIVPFEEAITFTADDFALTDKTATVTIKNNADFHFKNLGVKLESSLFEYSEIVEIMPNDEKIINVPLPDLRGKTAGGYILRLTFTKNEFVKQFSSDIQFLEKSSTDTKEQGSGFFVVERTVEKFNDGNVPTRIEIKIEKNVISRLFTSFSQKPDSVQRSGLSVTYIWGKELDPSEKFSISVFTNWIYPIAIFLVIIIVLITLKIAFTKRLIVDKQVIPVRTKGGEFALRVILRIKANKYIEKINLVDKLPPLVKIHEKFQTPPDKIHENSGRLEWNLGSLAKGEERKLSYIVYSKVAVMGKFELPPALAVYERNGKIEDSRSNKVFFLAEEDK